MLNIGDQEIGAMAIRNSHTEDVTHRNNDKTIWILKTDKHPRPRTFFTKPIRKLSQPRNL
jgi:hypothetical protein